MTEPNLLDVSDYDPSESDDRSCQAASRNGEEPSRR